MKRTLSVIIAIVLMVSVLAACGAGSKVDTAVSAVKASTAAATSTPAESSAAAPTTTAKAASDFKGELTQWTWYGEWLEAWSKEFNKTYPNIKMKIVVYSFDDYFKKVRTALAGGGGAPDIIELEDSQMAWLKNTNQLENLSATPYNADTGIFFKGSAEALRDKDGNQVALPEATGPSGIFYNRELVKKYLGVDDPEDVKKLIGSGEQGYDKFIDAMKAVTEKSGGKVKGTARLQDILDMFHRQKGNNFFDGSKVIYETTYKDDYTLLDNIAKLGITAKLSGSQNENAYLQTFKNGTVAFYPGANWFIGYYIPVDDTTKGKWGFVPSPGPGWDWGSQGTAIYKGSKNKDLAWEWLKWYNMSDEGAITQWKSGSLTPGLVSAFNSPEIIDTMEPTTNQKIGLIYKAILETAVPLNRTQDDSAIGDVTASVMSDLEAGKLTGDAALKKVVDEALKRLKGFTR